MEWNAPERAPNPGQGSHAITGLLQKRSSTVPFSSPSDLPVHGTGMLECKRIGGYHYSRLCIIILCAHGLEPILPLLVDLKFC